jgi:hypothetical protein
MLDDGQYSGVSEKFVLQTRDSIILAAIANGKHVIVDDTNLNPKHEAHLRELVKGKATVEIKDFTDIPVHVCIERDLRRFHSVGKDVIVQMYDQYLKPKPVEPDYDINLPNAVICDMDGTLSLLNGRSPYDASTSDNDKLHAPVHSIISNLPPSTRLIVCSGREEKDKEPTERFLKKHGIFPDLILMRATGDMRKDAIVKKELYDNHIKGKFNILYVLDDRKQVVDMWRSLGLTCLQVAEGNF